MCQAIAEGGRRCPRHRRDAMVALYLAASSTKLPLAAVASVFTELRREGRHIAYVDATDKHEELIANFQSQVELRQSPRYERLLSESGQDGTPPPDTLYALDKLQERAHKSLLALNSEVDSIAEKYGQDTARTRARYIEIREGLGELSGDIDDESYTADSHEAAHKAGIPKDAATIIALSRLEGEYSTLPERQARFVEGDYHPVFTEGSFRAAYDPRDGHLHLLSLSGTSSARYRDVPGDIYEEWKASRYSMPFFTRHIMRNSAYRYASLEAAETDSYTYRCADCGQFQALVHACRYAPPLEASVEHFDTLEEAHSFQSSVTTLPENGRFASLLRRSGTPNQSELGRELDSEATFVIPEERVRELGDAGVHTLRYRTVSSLLQGLPVDDTGMYMEDRGYVSGSLTVSDLRNLPPSTAVLHGDHLEGGRMFFGHPLDTTRSVPTQGVITIPYRSKPLTVPIYQRGYVDRRSFTEDEHRIIAARELAQYRAETVGEVTFMNAHSEHEEGQRLVIRERAIDRINWGDRLKVRQGFNENPIVEGELSWRGANSSGPAIDELGYDVGTGLFGVKGKLAIRKDEHGIFQVVSPRSALKCSCAQYSESYHCVHIDYVHNHAPRVAHQMSASLLGEALSQNRATREVDESTGRTRVSFSDRAADESRSEENSFSAFTRREMWEDETDVPTLSAIESLNRGTFYLPNKAEVREALAEHDEVEVPFSLPYGYDPLVPGSQFQVKGRMQYSRTEDGRLARSISAIRCSCGRFTNENASCVHTSVIEQHHETLFAPNPTEEAPGWRRDDSRDASMELNHHLEDTGFNENLRIWRMASRDGISFEEARTAVLEEDAEAERLAEQARRNRVERALAQMKGQLPEFTERHADFVKNNPDYDSYRASQQRLWENVEERYGDDISTVTSLVEKTQRQRGSRANALGYRTDNVTDGVCDPSVPGSRRFGVELEFTFPDSVDADKANQAIAAELYEAGLADTKTVGGYHAGRESGWPSWSLEEDDTVHGELVSPLMADTPEHWEQLNKALAILKKHGATTSTKAGSHVHVSSGSFSGKLAKSVEVLRTMKENEDVLYRAASNPSTGSHRGTEWCAPNVSTTAYGDIGKDAYDTDSPEYQQSKLLAGHMGHASAVNLADATGMSTASHIEYRLWDSSLDAATIQKQIIASVAITETAERSVNNNDGNSVQRAGEEVEKVKGLGATSKRLGKGGTSDVDDVAVKNLAAFVDRVFRRKEDREDFIRLYALNKNPKK